MERGTVESGAVSVEWHQYGRGWETVLSEVIEEAQVTFYVNGQELVTIMATPRDQDLHALGLLKNEGLIEGMDEVELVQVSQAGCCVDVWLDHPFTMPRRKIITSGCGGGVTFSDPSVGIQPLSDPLTIGPEALFGLFPLLHFPDSLHARARGVHAAAVSDGERVLALVEDVGRHNTIDKVLGACMVQAVEPRGRILLATGRISSEMLHKGARMGCPIIASRNSPTSMAVAMAQAWNVTLIGYVRQRSMRVYTHPHRLVSVADTPVLEPLSVELRKVSEAGNL
jgi:FdhD protein